MYFDDIVNFALTAFAGLTTDMNVHPIRKTSQTRMSGSLWHV